MKPLNRILTRRDFIRAGSCAAIGGLISLPFNQQARAHSQKKSRVVLTRDPMLAESNGEKQYQLLAKMIDEALMVLFETDQPALAWQQVADSKDVVGIKSNVWRFLSTPTALENIVTNRLLDVGVSEKNIAVDDRGVRRNPVFRARTFPSMRKMDGM